jgi:hypothetical protein
MTTPRNNKVKKTQILAWYRHNYMAGYLLLVYLNDVIETCILALVFLLELFFVFFF